MNLSDFYVIFVPHHLFPSFDFCSFFSFSFFPLNFLQFPLSLPFLLQLPGLVRWRHRFHFLETDKLYLFFITFFGILNFISFVICFFHYTFSDNFFYEPVVYPTGPVFSWFPANETSKTMETNRKDQKIAPNGSYGHFSDGTDQEVAQLSAEWERQ